MDLKHRMRAAIAFAILFVLYQSAEGIGGRWLGNFAVQAAFMVACVVAAWPLSRWLGYRGYGAYALDLRPRSFGWLASGLALAMGAKAAAIGIGLQLGVLRADGEAASLLSALPMLLLSTFVASIAEDILTRGFWYRAAGIAWQRGAAFVAFSTLAYVLNHIYRLGNGPMEWLLLASYGLAYGLAVWRTGTLWAAVGLHWGWNLANGVFALTWPTDVADAASAPLLSIAAHLVMAALVLLATLRTARR